jgi:outer membrane protein
MKFTVPVLVLAVLLFAAASPAQTPDGVAVGAAPPTAPPPSGLRWSLGLGVISSPRPYVGASNQITPIPLIELYYKKLYVQGIQAGYHFIDNEKFTLDMRAGFVFAGLDPKDSPDLAGMMQRDPTIELGFVFDWKPGKYKLSTSITTDILGVSNGQQAETNFSRTWMFGQYRWGLTPSIGVVWQSSNYIDYYYGVTPEEVQPGRPEFIGHSAVNFQSGLLAFYRLSGRVTLVGLVQIQRLDNEIFLSPIVDNQRAIFGLLGATYRFGRSPGGP